MVDNITLSQLFELYRTDYIVFKNQSPKTEENHLICGRSIVSFLGDIYTYDLNFEMVRRWKVYLCKGRSDATVRNYIIKLRVVLAYARRRGYDVLDPFIIPVPKRADTVAQYVTSEEVEHMINYTTRIRSKAIISLLYGSGIRLSELLNLNKCQIINSSFTVVGKGGKARLCFIDRRTVFLLGQYQKTRKDNHASLFVSTKKPINRMTATNIQLIVKIAALKAGIDRHVTPHTLRHAFATNFIHNNGGVRHLQVLMGHSSLDTTAHYAHVIDEDLRHSYELAHSV